MLVVDKQAAEGSVFDPKGYLSEFRKRQSQRAATYSEFQIFFKGYLEDGDAKKYSGLVKSTTIKFQAIGNEILQLERKLIECDQKEWAGWIRKVQHLEKKKLQLTVKCQTLKANITGLKRRQEKNSEKNHSHTCGRGSSECDMPSVESLTRELKKAKGVMGKLVGEINDVLEEVKYAVYDK